MKHFLYLLFVPLMLLSVSYKSEKKHGDNHEYVNLGLPSGTLWATCNVGATKPTDYGDLFAWGETSSKDTFTTENYKFYKTKDNKLETTKYNTTSENGNVDNMTVLDPQDDAAAVRWGGSWRMPTREEIQELIDGCTWMWTDDYEGNKVAGQIFKSKHNGNSIFLPAAGYGYNEGHGLEGFLGSYWSRSIDSSYPANAYELNINTSFSIVESNDRSHGRSVRAVRSSKK